MYSMDFLTEINNLILSYLNNNFFFRNNIGSCKFNLKV